MYLFHMKEFARFRDAALLILRLAVASAFLYHGTQKWTLFTMVPDGMPSGMLPIMQILAIAEPLAGIALIAGVLTQLAAAGLIIIMIGAMFTKITADMPFSAWELDLLLFAASLVILMMGPGRLSADAVIAKDHHDHSYRHSPVKKKR